MSAKVFEGANGVPDGGEQGRTRIGGDTGLTGLGELPYVVRKLLAWRPSADASPGEAARILELDPALAARLLQLANSPSFGLRNRIATLSQAVTMLGFPFLRKLAVVLGIREVLEEEPNGGGVLSRSLWRHCVAVAAAAHAIAVEVGYATPQDAYDAGLLHDIGIAALHRRLGKAYGAVLDRLREEGELCPSLERRLLGLDHAEAGARVAEAWRLPSSLSCVLRYHHLSTYPEGQPPSHAQLVSIIHVADFLCWTHGLAPIEARRPPQLSSWAEKHVRLQGSRLDRVMAAMDREVKLMGQAFRWGALDARECRVALQRSTLELAALGESSRPEIAFLHCQVGHLTGLLGAVRKLRSSESLAELHGHVTGCASGSLGYERALWMCADLDRGEVHIDGDPSPLSLPLDTTDPFFRLCLDGSQAFPFSLAEPQTSGWRILNHLELPEAVAAPIHVEGRLHGILLVGNAGRLSLVTRETIDLLTVLASEAGEAVRSLLRAERLTALSITDELTALYNRRFLLEALDAEMERSRRYGRPLCVAMCDLDRFKLVNDTHGHMLGDKVLRVVAKLIKFACRKVDIVGRYGGEEFLIVLPETPLESSIVCLERVRRRVKSFGDALSVKLLPRVAVSMSLGVAPYVGAAQTREQFIERADSALRQAKDQGRNRVRVFLDTECA